MSLSYTTLGYSPLLTLLIQAVCHPKRRRSSIRFKAWCIRDKLEDKVSAISLAALDWFPLAPAGFRLGGP